MRLLAYRESEISISSSEIALLTGNIKRHGKQRLYKLQLDLTHAHVRTCHAGHLIYVCLTTSEFALSHFQSWSEFPCFHRRSELGGSNGRTLLTTLLVTALKVNVCLKNTAHHVAIQCIITLRAKHSGAVYCNRSCLRRAGGRTAGGRPVSITTITRNCMHIFSPNLVCR